MFFESLSEKIQGAFKTLTGKGVVSSEDIDKASRQIKLALLEADVNLTVVRKFINSIKEKANNEKVLGGLNPAQQVIKIVKDEMISLLGEEAKQIEFDSKQKIVMVVGLQGSGKTTTISKLAHFWRKNNDRKPFLIAADVYRPAAIDQLAKLAGEINVPIYYDKDQKDVNKIIKSGISQAKEDNSDLILIDTAGRMQIDEDLMNELISIQKNNKINETILVIDSMIGQESVNVATGFNEKIKLTGAVITKLDGDTRGGAAISVRDVTNVPILFSATGEKVSEIEIFHPDRMASRILGMGDILGIIEKAEDAFDKKDAIEMQKKLKSATFDFEDFLKQIEQVNKMGSMKNIMKMIPGMNKFSSQIENADLSQFDRIKSIIYSMTKYERQNPSSLKTVSRKKRIADGSGTSIAEINRLLKQFEQMKKVMKQFSGKGGMSKLMKGGMF